MALNQSVRLPVGLTGLVARVEALWYDLPSDDSGRSRRYWDADPAGPSWTTNPVANLPLVADPDLPGVYLLTETTARMASWTDGPVRITVLDPAGSILAGPDDIFIQDSDDRGGPTYTFDVPGGTVTVAGKFNPASYPPTRR